MFHIPERGRLKVKRSWLIDKGSWWPAAQSTLSQRSIATLAISVLDLGMPIVAQLLHTESLPNMAMERGGNWWFADAAG